MTGAFIEAVSARLARADLVQVLVAYLSVLAFAVLVSWPTELLRPNNSWHALAQTQAVLLMLLGLAFGSALGRFVLPSRGVTLAALVVMVSFSLPLEVGSYAASFPGVPLFWTLLLTPLTLVAYFGLGIGLGALLRAMKLDILLPILIPVTIAGVFYVDNAIGLPLLNPMMAVTRVTPEHVGMMSVLSLVTVAVVVFLDRRTAREAPGEAVSSA
jgi:hypothetical protein